MIKTFTLFYNYLTVIFSFDLIDHYFYNNKFITKHSIVNSKINKYLVHGVLNDGQGPGIFVGWGKRWTLGRSRLRLDWRTINQFNNDDDFSTNAPGIQKIHEGLRLSGGSYRRQLLEFSGVRFFPAVFSEICGCGIILFILYKRKI